MTLYEFLKPFVVTSPVPSTPVELWTRGGNKIYEGELRKIPAICVICGCVVYKADIGWGERKLIIVIDVPEEGEI